MKLNVGTLRHPSYAREYLSLIKLGLPVLVAQVGIIVVSFADTMMVGEYGTPELAAAAFVNSFFMVPVVMLIGLASGVTPLIGALFSRKENYEAGRVLRAALWVNVATALACMVIMGVLYFFIDRMGQPPELLPLIRPYYLLVLLGVLPIAVFNCCQQMANGVTDTSMPMWFMLASNAVNICGNYCLIYGHFGFPELGLIGAGISTLAARWLACAGILLVMFLSRRYRPYQSGLRNSRSLGERPALVWRTSYPVMIQSGIECFLWTFGAIVSGWFGTVQLAAYQVVNTMAQLGFMTFISFGTATSIRVANYNGLNDITGMRRIATAGLHINLALATIASAIFIFLGFYIIGLFTPNAEVVEAAMLLVPPLVLYQYCDATQLTYANALRGTSYVKPLLWISLTAYMIVGVPVLLLMACWLGMESVGVYYSFTFALLVAAALLIVSFRKTLRRREASAPAPYLPPQNI